MNQINVQPGQKVFEFTEKQYAICEPIGPFPDVEEVRITDMVEKILIYNQQQPIFSNVKKLIIESHMIIDDILYYWEMLFTTIDTINLQFMEKVYMNDLKYFGYRTANFEVTEQNPYYMAIDGILYTKDGTGLIRCPVQKQGKVFIPEGVKMIDTKAFRDCSVASVIFPQSLQKIRQYAFCHCDNLSQVDFCDGINSIEDWSFYGCKKLHIVTLPASIRTLGEQCFPDVHNVYIQSDRFPRGIVNSINNMWSDNCTTVTNNTQTIIVPKNLTGHYIQIVEIIIQNQPIDQKTINIMFSYANTEECKLKTAFAIYQRFQSPEAAQYLREHSLEALNLFVKEHQDKQIIDFVQFGLANLNDLQSLLSSEYTHNPTVKAYILQAIKYHTGNTNETFKL